jgi:hypothetical protein
VKNDFKNDKHRNLRLPQDLKVHITQLPCLGSAKGKVFAGRIQTISSGGMCVITSHALPEAALLRCDISIDETPIHIPTLAQVDRSERQNILSNQFYSELSFIL